MDSEGTASKPSKSIQVNDKTCCSLLNRSVQWIETCRVSSGQVAVLVKEVAIPEVPGVFWKVDIMFEGLVICH